MTFRDQIEVIISQKFEIFSGILWFCSGCRLRHSHLTQPPHAAARCRHTPPPHAAARNCDTNARIKFIFDTAIDDLEWKNPIDF